MGAPPDPVSVQFEAAAARLLRRAHNNRGQWTGTYIANPGPDWERWGRQHGIRLLGPDTVPGGMCKTRWVRAFVRACYRLMKNHYYEGRGLDLGERRTSPGAPRALKVEVGNSVRIDKAGRVVGRPVRIIILEGGKAANTAARKLPDSQRTYVREGGGYRKGPRWSDPSMRDWS